jgi:hypothetical protein
VLEGATVDAEMTMIADLLTSSPGPLRSTRDIPALVNDQPRQPQPGARCQSSAGVGSVGHEDLLVVKWFLGSSTPHREVFTRLETQIAPSHDLDQRLWTSQSVRDDRQRLDVVVLDPVGPGKAMPATKDIPQPAMEPSAPMLAWMRLRHATI